jgi:polysaccharide biosynthesis/export protein
MTRMRHGWFPGLLLAIVLVAAASPGLARAVESYLIGPEDVLSLTVWEHPELSRTVVVRADGTITLPPLGDIPAAGTAPADLARTIESRIYNTLRFTTQATISVIAFNSRRVFLSGQVTSPGRYGFEELPGLVDLLGSAGGLNAAADLSAVRILRRKEGGSPTTLTVDLATAVQSGDLSAVPKLESGDVIYVPSAAGGGTGQVAGGSSVYVMGEVLRPGAYSLLPGMDLMQLLAIAGGLSPRADLSRVLVLGADVAGGPFRVKVDMRREMETGGRGPEIRMGDTVIVTSIEAGTAATAWNVMRESLGISRDVLNLFLIKDVLRNRSTN